MTQNDSEQSQKGQQDPKKGARKGCIPKGLQSPQEGFTVFAALLVVTVVFCYHFCSLEKLKNSAAHMCMLVSAHIR